jgi:hypothetical protein
MQRAELLSTAGVAPYLDCYDLRQLFWKSDSKQKKKLAMIDWEFF